MTIEPKAGDVIRIKTEKRRQLPLLATVVARSGSYAGWSVTLDDGLGGIVLDGEVAGIES